MPTPHPSLVLDDWAPLVTHAVGDLTNERHRYILLRRFGLLDGPNTLQAIADEFAISRERVRQLEGKALTRIHTRARRPGTTAHALATAFNQLPAHDDHTLVSRLVDTAGPQFRCQPSWLVKALSRMAGQSPDRTDHLVELTRNTSPTGASASAPDSTNNSARPPSTNASRNGSATPPGPPHPTRPPPLPSTDTGCPKPTTTSATAARSTPKNSAGQCTSNLSLKRPPS